MSHRARLLMALTLVVPAPAASATPLPVDLELQAGAVTLELDSAVVRVTVEDGLLPRLRARVATEADGDVLELAIEQGADTVRVRRADQTQTQRLIVDLELTPGQWLWVGGRDLDVAVTRRAADTDPTGDGSWAGDDSGRAPEPQGVEADPAEEAVNSDAEGGMTLRALTLQIEGSAAILTGVVDASVTARDSSLVAADGRGTLALDLEGGVAEVSGFHGSLNLTGRGAEITLSDASSPTVLELEGGSLFVRDSRGRLTGRLDRASLQVLGSEANAELSVTDASVELHDSRGALNVQGTGSDLRADAWTGSVNLRVEGGSIVGNEWHGSGTVTAAGGATCDLDGVQGNLQLQITDRGRGTLADLEGQLSCEIIESRLDVSNVAKLTCTAKYSDLTISDVVVLARMEALESTLDLSMRAARNRPVLELEGRSYATVELPGPCLVKLEGPGAVPGGSTLVNGCDQILPGQARPRHRRLMTGEHRTELRVLLGADAELEVRGSP